MIPLASQIYTAAGKRSRKALSSAVDALEGKPASVIAFSSWRLPDSYSMGLYKGYLTIKFYAIPSPAKIMHHGIVL
jgi:hypothetical protein